MKISDRLYSHQNSVRSLTRRLSEHPTGVHASSGFQTTEIDQDIKFHKSFAKFLGIDQVLVEQIRLKQIQMPDKTPLEIAATPTKKSKPSSPRELSPLPAKAPPTVEAQTVEPPTAQPLTVEPPAVETLTTSSQPVSTTTDFVPSVSTADICRQPSEPVPATIPVIPAPKPLTGQTRKIPIPRLPKKTEELLQPLPTPSDRATKLLSYRGMPKWQPARCAWDQDEQVSFVEGDLCIFWPPKDWKKLDPQQKLLQWQFAAMSLMKACGDDYIQVTQSHLLDQFNFLALRGTAEQRAPKNSPSYMLCKSLLYTYELLRAIANGKHRDDSWLTMVVLFLFDSLHPINNLSVKQGRVFLG